MDNRKMIEKMIWDDFVEETKAVLRLQKILKKAAADPNNRGDKIKFVLRNEYKELNDTSK